MRWKDRGCAAPAPTAITTGPTAVTDDSATLHGTVNPNATTLTGCQFTISPAPPGGPALTCAQQVGSGTAPVPVSAQLLGLSPSTTYTVRLTATDAQGPSTGAPVLFRTLPPPPRITQLNVRVTRRHGRRQGAIKLTVTQAAKLVFTLERRKAKQWVALPRSIAATAKAGTTTIGFSIGGLGAGHYRMTGVATNSAAERSSPRQVTFSISP